MNRPATSEDCPCCHTCLSPGADTDRALVIAFLGGAAARDFSIPVGQALCAKHGAMAGDCMNFVVANAPRPS